MHLIDLTNKRFGKNAIELEVALKKLGTRNFHERRLAASLFIQEMMSDA